MSEREWLTKQIEHMEQQRSQAVATAQQCQGGLTLARGRLAILDREEAEARAGATTAGE